MSWFADPDTHVQIFIALFGVTAIALSQCESPSLRRWASVFGLVSQPFWYWTSWHAEQWGIFALSFLYTAAWMKGFWGAWVKPLPEYSAAAHLESIRTCLEVDAGMMARDETAMLILERYAVIASQKWMQDEMKALEPIYIDEFGQVEACAKTGDDSTRPGLT